MAAKRGNTSGGVGDTRISVRMIAFGVLAVLAVWFILMNRASVRIHFWGLTAASAPLWAILVIMLLVGVALGWLGRRYRDRGR